ncbi:MAG: hypothetical protein AAGH83_00230 [Pseudomonadota bacterium]
MILVELSVIPIFDLPINQFKDHLRLGTGFSDDGWQDTVLEQSLRAAIAAIEARTGKVLFNRAFRWTIGAWRSSDRQALPVAPVTEITGINLVDRNGVASATDPETWYLEQDSQRPLLRASRACLPTIPEAGSAEVSFLAGFSADWASMPGDLAQAVLLLAAHYYEVRGEQPLNDGNMPFGVSTLIERYRTVRILGGGAS